MKWFRRRLRPSPSMAVGLAALVVALGGTSYAALTLPAKSVGTKQLRRNAVRHANIGRNAVDGSNVDDDTLTGSDVMEESLAQVPAAATADHANAAAALDRITYKTAGGAALPATPPAPAPAPTATITPGSVGCDGGQHVVGGGVRLDDPDNTSVVDSYPDAGGTAWTVHVDNSDNAAAHGFTVYAICATSATIG